MLLEKIEQSSDIKKLKVEDYPVLAQEIRQFLLEKISRTGGHLASNLGVVELTMALHLAFDLPKDKIIWDVGHQAYTHKILSGRKDGFDDLRQFGGMSGFPKRKESPYDAFDTGHSSTSISAGLGIAQAREILGEDYSVISIIGDGALTALAVAAKLLDMQKKGDFLEGDVFISTHVCPDAPTTPHEPVPFMNSPVETWQVNKEEVTDDLDAVLVVDTTKGNRIINHRGFAISPTVKEGYILRVSEDLLDVMISTTGRLPHVFALSQQDITPYGNGLYHLNSILQPATATKAPVVGVAVTTETTVAGCATGATHLEDLEDAGRFMLEAAKAFGNGLCSFYDEEEFGRIQKLYGSMEHFQTLGKQ